MPGLKRYSKLTVMVVAVLSACFVVASVVSAAVVPRPTLQLAKHASVTDQATRTTVESIVVNVRGRAVYELSGDSARHPKCTRANGCFQFWPPVEVRSRKSLHKATGITGKLRTWRRNGFFQVTLNGHPLYRFFGDSRPRVATGEGVTSFGGVWHVLRGAGDVSFSGHAEPDIEQLDDDVGQLDHDVGELEYHFFQVVPIPAVLLRI